MKINNIFAIAAGLFVLAACTPEENELSTFEGGLDTSKPTVSDVAYDAVGSGAAAVAVTWNADKALAAGATSFTYELCTDKNFEGVNNASIYTIVNAPATAGTISKLTEGEYYYVRVRANYDGLLYSNWSYMPDGVCVGKGVVEIVFAAPANLSAKPTDISFEASWDKVPFATSYTFEYKGGSATDWVVASDLKATKYEVVGLTETTTYEIRVKAFKGEESTDYATASVTTKETSKFNPNITTADQFVEFMTTEAPEASAAATYTLGADIDLAGKTVPAVAEFKGSIDGQNHVIKNLSISEPLFTLLKGNVSNIVFDSSCKFTPSGLVFGVIAKTNEGTISGCTNKANISFSQSEITESLIYGAIAGVSTGAISDCTNEGAIAVSSETYIKACEIGGIVGYMTASVSGCTNKGALSLNAKNISSKSDVIDVTNTLPSLGGIVGLSFTGFKMDKCDNYGKITVSYTNADDGLTANLNRNQHGGLVGSPVGPVSNCNNYGDIDISIKNSTPGTALAKEYIVCVGGIGGGDYVGTNDKAGPFANTSYTNCVNEGNITVYSDASASNSTVGGIVGWPGQEKAITDIMTKNCTNKGNITVSGALKGRFGGIQGGTGVMDGCINEGKITVESANAGSAVGSLCGFHSQGHAITNCKANGEVITKVALTGGNGGLIGNMGNVASTTGTGCSVNCKITTPATDPQYTGFVVGKFNSNAESPKAITLGTADDPIKVKGSINGVGPNADNMYGTYLWNPVLVVFTSF